MPKSQRKIVGTIIQDRTSVRKKFYSVLIVGGNVFVRWGTGDSMKHGMSGTVKTLRTQRSGTLTTAETMTEANAAFQKALSQYRTKRHNGYTEVGGAQIVTLPSNIDPTDARKVHAHFISKYKFDAPNPRGLNGIGTMRDSYKQAARLTAESLSGLVRDVPDLNEGQDTSTTTKAAAQRKSAAKKKASGNSLRCTTKIFRPNGEEYLPRKVGNHHDVALLRHLMEKSIFVRLYGPPGGGKSALAEASFPESETINGHGDMTVQNFVGTFLPTENGGWKFGDGPLVKCAREGKVLFVDEITRIPTEVLAVLYSAMDGRGYLRIDDRPDLEPVKIQKGFGVIAGYNPDTLGAKALDEALISRFPVGIEVKTDWSAAQRLGVPENAINLARNLDTRDKNDRRDGGAGYWVPQMRELLAFRDLVNAGVGEQFAANVLLASCPREIDQEVVADAAKKVFGFTVDLPSLGTAA